MKMNSIYQDPTREKITLSIGEGLWSEKIMIYPREILNKIPEGTIYDLVKNKNMIISYRSRIDLIITRLREYRINLEANKEKVNWKMIEIISGDIVTNYWRMIEVDKLRIVVTELLLANYYGKNSTGLDEVRELVNQICNVDHEFLNDSLMISNLRFTLGPKIISKVNLIPNCSHSLNYGQIVSYQRFLKGIPTTLVESGTYLGGTVSNLFNNFQKIHTIELSDEIYRQITNEEGLDSKICYYRNITFYKGNSKDILPMIMPLVNEEAIFFLDGHYSSGMTAKGEEDSPLLAEISIIDQGLKHPSVIICDDYRLFGIKGEEDYSKITDESIAQNFVRCSIIYSEVQDDRLILTVEPPKL
jgi:hypothetical protein